MIKFFIKLKIIQILISKRIEVIKKRINNIKLKNILARAVAYEEIMNSNNQNS